MSFFDKKHSRILSVLNNHEHVDLIITKTMFKSFLDLDELLEIRKQNKYLSKDNSYTMKQAVFVALKKPIVNHEVQAMTDKNYLNSCLDDITQHLSFDSDSKINFANYSEKLRIGSISISDETNVLHGIIKGGVFNKQYLNETIKAIQSKYLKVPSLTWIGFYPSVKEALYASKTNDTIYYVTKNK